jgi:hypothetical protein
MREQGSNGPEVLSKHKRGGTYSTNLILVANGFNDTEFYGISGNFEETKKTSAPTITE